MTVRSPAILAVLLIVFAAATFLVSPGFFNIDEFVYFAGAKAFSNGMLAVPGELDGESFYQLRLWLLVQGPSGLVPQYPIGSAAIGGLLLPIFGLPGLMLYNALAAAGVVFLTYNISLRHFGGVKVGIGAALLLILATFFLEYAFAVWPHAVGMLAILASVKLLLDHIHDDENFALRTLGMGAWLGLGLLFRTDVAVAVPAVAIVLYFYSRKPVIDLSRLAVGLAPFVAILSVVNHFKFGTFNPVSYGQTHSGGTNLATHYPVLIALFLVGVAALVLRNTLLDPKNRKVLFLALVVLGLAALAVAHGFLLRYAHGFWALIVDSRTIIDDRPGVVRWPDGSISFWGHWKKALGQSMPWLGILGAAIFITPANTRKTVWAVLILCVAWSLPFFPRDWHGGMGSNMRYFLPLIPLLCALAANLIACLFKHCHRPRLVFVTAAVLGFYHAPTFSGWHPSGSVGTQQVLTFWLFLTTTLFGLLVGWTRLRQLALNLILLVLTGSGIGLALHVAYIDFTVAQKGRELSEDFSEANARIPQGSLVYAPSRFLVGWALEPGNLAALPNDRTGAFDANLIEAAIRSGKRVYIWPGYVNQQIENDQGYILVPSDDGKATHRLLELLPVEGAGVSVGR